MSDLLSIVQATHELEKYGIRLAPQKLSESFYRRYLPPEWGQIIGHQRLIERKRIPDIAHLLKTRKRGQLF